MKMLRLNRDPLGNSEKCPKKKKEEKKKKKKSWRLNRDPFGNSEIYVGKYVHPWN